MTTAVRTAEIRRAVQRFDFRTLFVEELGWDIYRAGPLLPVEVGGETYTLRGVAEKRGAVALVCEPDANGGIPNYATRKKIDTQVGKAHHEHVIIYVDRDADHKPTRQIWQWVRRRAGRPTAYPEQPFYKGQSGEALVQRLRELYVDLNQEESLTVLDVSERMQKAFDVEKVTRRFYDRFKTEHAAFLKAIEGIGAQGDREWYASLMLNRLMFTYFIQKKEFLDGDSDYLRNRLKSVRQRIGPDQFHSFYRSFLLVLFHNGLGQPVAERSAEVNALIGRIPYLNGGLFEIHTIERANREIAIPDEAFAQVFEFFEEWRWHLDERETSAGDEINPDVLGYIFEKYINQKQMGAYYTKEDITDYIGKNTILPFLFDAAREKCKVAFEPGGEVWRLLQDDPDRYIYEAVRKGVDLPLPPEIEAGVEDISKRGGWNRAADAEYALPTETWREHVARRTRCRELRAKLAAGEVASVNDLITYNLDITRFAQDVIERAEGLELLRAFWQAMAGREARAGQAAEPGVTILDPTCGSGAFLFAALNLLEPLYEACLTRMEAFVAELDRQGERGSAKDFRETLARMNDKKVHPNRRYFILKAIIVNNLYGVDIMEEAVEIAKLRLFLKLVAQAETAEQIEPLPDIDFNIRCGNTLVGFATLDAVRQAMMYGPKGQMRMLSAEDEETLARIDEQAEIAARAYAQFRAMQSERGMSASAFRNAKELLRERLDALRDELDRYLAREYGIAAEDDLFAFGPWRASHQPFHWFVEFYGIVQARGGFDVIIGNPPYVELRTLADYSFKGLTTVATRNLYAPMMERSLSISRSLGRLGFIVPVSSISTEGYRTLQDVIFSHPIHVSSYDDRPSRLFDGLEHIRLSIHLIQNTAATTGSRFATECYRWNAEERATLFSRLRYQSVEVDYVPDSLPKISRDLELSILKKIWKDRLAIGDQTSRLGAGRVYFSRKLSSFLQVLDFVPQVYDGAGKSRPPSEFKELRFDRQDQAEVVFCLFNSTLFRWFMNVFSDFRHVNKREIDGFRLDLAVAVSSSGEWHTVSARLSRSLQDTSEFRQMKFSHDTLRVQCIIPKFSKPIIDEIDGVLGEHYGFTEEELDFIVNYDIKYRMGQENGNDEG